MLKSEFSKLLRNRHGLLLILLALTLQIIGLFFTQPYDFQLEDNREVYESFLQQYHGELTPEHREAIDGQMELLNQNHTDLDRLQTQYYNGQIPTGEYRSKLDAMLETDALYPGFGCLYRQYVFVRNQPGRQFLYTGGWELLLGQQEPPYLLLLLLIFLLVPVFCQEYPCQMDSILLTQKESSRSAWKVKIAVACILSFGIVTLWELIRLLYLSVRFGLPDWNYQLDSLYRFGDTQKGLPLWGAWLLQLGLKQLGFLSCGMWILFLSVLLKKYSMTLMACLILLPVPFLTAPVPFAFLRVPGPWAYVTGSIYLSGPQYFLDNGIVAGEFREAGWGELALNTAALLGIGLLQLTFIRRRFLNRHSFRRKAAAATASVLVICLLSGCAPRTDSPVIYNASDAGSFENADMVISPGAAGSYQLFDKSTGITVPFPLSTVPEEEASLLFFEKDGCLYYYRNYGQTLYRVDLATLKTDAVHTWDVPEQIFFGLMKTGEQENDSFYSFFLHGNDFYGMGNDGLVKIDLNTNRRTPMNRVKSLDYAYDGETLYYTDRYNRLVAENLNTGSTRTLEEVVASFFRLTPEGIYFLNPQDSGALYLWDGETARRICDGSGAYAMLWDPEYLWLVNIDGLVRVNHDGSEPARLATQGFISRWSQGPDFLLTVMEDEETTSYRVNKTSLTMVPVPSTDAD